MTIKTKKHGKHIRRKKGKQKRTFKKQKRTFKKQKRTFKKQKRKRQTRGGGKKKHIYAHGLNVGTWDGDIFKGSDNSFANGWGIFQIQNGKINYEGFFNKGSPIGLLLQTKTTTNDKIFYSYVNGTLKKEGTRKDLINNQALHKWDENKASFMESVEGFKAADVGSSKNQWNGIDPRDEWENAYDHIEYNTDVGRETMNKYDLKVSGKPSDEHWKEAKNAANAGKISGSKGQAKQREFSPYIGAIPKYDKDGNVILEKRLLNIHGWGGDILKSTVAAPEEI